MIDKKKRVIAKKKTTPIKPVETAEEKIHSEEATHHKQHSHEEGAAAAGRTGAHHSHHTHSSPHAEEAAKEHFQREEQSKHNKQHHSHKPTVPLNFPQLAGEFAESGRPLLNAPLLHQEQKRQHSPVAQVLSSDLLEFSKQFKYEVKHQEKKKLIHHEQVLTQPDETNKHETQMEEKQSADILEDDIDRKIKQAFEESKENEEHENREKARKEREAQEGKTRESQKKEKERKQKQMAQKEAEIKKHQKQEEEEERKALQLKSAQQQERERQEKQEQERKRQVERQQERKRQLQRQQERKRQVEQQQVVNEEKKEQEQEHEEKKDDKRDEKQEEQKDEKEQKKDGQKQDQNDNKKDSDDKKDHKKDKDNNKQENNQNGKTWYEQILSFELPDDNGTTVLPEEVLKNPSMKRAFYLRRYKKLFVGDKQALKMLQELHQLPVLAPNRNFLIFLHNLQQKKQGKVTKSIEEQERESREEEKKEKLVRFQKLQKKSKEELNPTAGKDELVMDEVDGVSQAGNEEQQWVDLSLTQSTSKFKRFEKAEKRLRIFDKAVLLDTMAQTQVINAEKSVQEARQRIRILKEQERQLQERIRLRNEIKEDIRIKNEEQELIKNDQTLKADQTQNQVDGKKLVPIDAEALMNDVQFNNEITQMTRIFEQLIEESKETFKKSKQNLKDAEISKKTVLPYNMPLKANTGATEKSVLGARWEKAKQSIALRRENQIKRATAEMTKISMEIRKKRETLSEPKPVEHDGTVEVGQEQKSEEEVPKQKSLKMLAIEQLEKRLNKSSFKKKIVVSKKTKWEQKAKPAKKKIEENRQAPKKVIDFKKVLSQMVNVNPEYHEIVRPTNLPQDFTPQPVVKSAGAYQNQRILGVRRRMRQVAIREQKLEQKKKASQEFQSLYDEVDGAMAAPSQQKSGEFKWDLGDHQLDTLKHLPKIKVANMDTIREKVKSRLEKHKTEYERHLPFRARSEEINKRYYRSLLQKEGESEQGGKKNERRRKKQEDQFYKDQYGQRYVFKDHQLHQLDGVGIVNSPLQLTKIEQKSHFQHKIGKQDRKIGVGKICNDINDLIFHPEKEVFITLSSFDTFSGMMSRIALNNLRQQQLQANLEAVAQINNDQQIRNNKAMEDLKEWLYQHKLEDEKKLARAIEKDLKELEKKRSTNPLAEIRINALRERLEELNREKLDDESGNEDFSLGGFKNRSRKERDAK